MKNQNKFFTLNKYFFHSSKTLIDSNETLKRQAGQTITGWFDSKNEWFPITYYHSHPAYIQKLQYGGSLDNTNILHIKKFYKFTNKYKSKGSDLFYEEQNKQMYECISLGAVRVIVRDNIVFLTASSLIRANKIFDKLLLLFNNLLYNAKFAVVDVIDSNGNVLFQGYYNEHKQKFQKNISNLHE